MKENDNLKSIGHNIQLARLKKEYTQETLAEKCNVSAKYISAIERGNSSGSIPLIIDICNILNISPNYIFNGCIHHNKLDATIEVFKPDTLTTFAKLKSENKQFVTNTIHHLYNMQKKR